MPEFIQLLLAESIKEGALIARPGASYPLRWAGNMVLLFLHAPRQIWIQVLGGPRPGLVETSRRGVFRSLDSSCWVQSQLQIRRVRDKATMPFHLVSFCWRPVKTKGSKLALQQKGNDLFEQTGQTVQQTCIEKCAEAVWRFMVCWIGKWGAHILQLLDNGCYDLAMTETEH